MQSVMVVGCGDVGLRVARHWADRGVTVTGVVRSEHSAGRLEQVGIASLQLDLDQPGEVMLPDPAGAVIHYHVPPPREGQGDPRINRFLSLLDQRGHYPQRIVYLSTSGVYGDCNGEWVTEERPPAPDSDRGRRRLAAEQNLLAWAEPRGVETVILRVPGIYGPGRLPIKRLRSGAPVVDERECAFSNRIHAEDLARIDVAAAERGRPGAVYNASDGHPTTMTDYFMQVCELLGLEPPPIISLDEAREIMTPAMLSFLGESRRLDNSQMLRDLKVKLRYPTLEKGLKTVIK